MTYLSYLSLHSYKLKLSHGSSITRVTISLSRNRNPFSKPRSRPGTKTFPHLEDTQAMFPGCVGSLNHSSTPRLKWVRESTSSILWLCTSTWARNRTEVPSVTSSFLYRIWNRLLVPGASNESGNNDRIFKRIFTDAPKVSLLKVYCVWFMNFSSCAKSSYDYANFRSLNQIECQLDISIFRTIN